MGQPAAGESDVLIQSFRSWRNGDVEMFSAGEQRDERRRSGFGVVVVGRAGRFDEAVGGEGDIAAGEGKVAEVGRGLIGPNGFFGAGNQRLGQRPAARKLPSGPQM